MLNQKFGLKIAEFRSLAELNLQEVEKADLIVIDGCVPGGIYHPNKVNWFGTLDLKNEPKAFIRSKKERKEIENNREYFFSRGYHLEILPLTEKLFNQFTELYKDTVLKKERAMNFNLERRVMSLAKFNIPVYIIGLFDKTNKLVAALIFDIFISGSVKEARVSYGAKQKFPEIRGGAGGVLEYELLKYCHENGISEISHGKAKNPAGLLSNSGIFEFKTRYGYTAYPDSAWKTMFIKNPESSLTDLVFVTIIDNELGYLIVTNEPHENIKNRYLTNHVRNIQVMSYEQVKDQYANFIRKSLPLLSK